MSEHSVSVKDKGPTPLYLRGRRFRRIGAAMFWVALVLVFATVPLNQTIGYAGFVLMAVALPALFLGLAVMRRGRKLMAASGEELLAADRRAPVVYLRPFTVDELGTGVATRFLGWRYFTEEEQLAMVMNEIGPFVAIGDPRESVADLGAARIYAREGGWQRKVSDLVARARLVILRVGTSEGFWYELEAVRASVRPAQVLLLVPVDRTEYAAFRDRARNVLPHPLPERIEVGALPLLGSVGGVIEFDDDWRPRPLPVARSFVRASFTAPYVARLKLTLKPVFERLGLQWSTPPVARGRQALLITSSVIFVLFGGLWLALKLPEWFYEPPPEDSPSYSAYSDTYVEVPSVTPALPSEPQPASAYDQALATFAARSNEVPELAAAMSEAASSEEARGIGAELSRRGLHRLSDARLLERTAIMSRILALADVQTCAAMMKGTARGMEPVLRQLDAEEIDRFFDMSFEAMVAEARQESGPPLPSQEELGLALQALVERLPSEEGERLVAVLGDPRQATDDDGCSAARSLYGGMAELPEAHQVVLARGLVAPE